MEYEDMGVVDVFARLKSSREGLSGKEAASRLDTYGFNELEVKKRITPFGVLLGQFANFIVWVLLAAALISFSINEIINFWVILFIVGFVIILGFIQEYTADRAMEALKDIVHPTTMVVRDGKLLQALTRDVVVGDVLVLETGDRVPADAILFDIIGLKVDESSLTGESVSVEKTEDDPLFAGTQIVHGKCKALVTATGMRTKLGGIAGMIQEEEEKTPLQQKINGLAKVLAAIALMASGLAMVLGIITGAPLEKMLIIALALAVAAVPAGLPLTMTITLGHGMRHMARHKAIVRKMVGVETLGSTTVICTDKTGTLTKNEMTVERIVIDGRSIDITGAGYEPYGNFIVDGEVSDISKYRPVSLLLKAAALCNNAMIEENNGQWGAVGDPTEVSLVAAAAKADIWKDDLELNYEKQHEIMFTSERKLMTTIHTTAEGAVAFSKGAPEFLLERCIAVEGMDRSHDLGEEDVRAILDDNSRLASSAYRVLGIAYRELPQSWTVGTAEEDLTFLGLVAMIDPVRSEAKEAVEVCRRAGIKVVMITGDNEETAQAIGRKVGLDDSTVETDGLSEKLKRIVADGAITGDELSSLSDTEFTDVVHDIAVYARVMPDQKLRIVRALQDQGEVVAMTGDGVNDAPALKKADIGIAMGIKGTDVAKESSVMVLQDDNFATIVEAVKQGRGIYENIEKFTCYLVSRNFTEVILILLGISLLGFELLPLLALQILFINMFDEIMPAIALGLDPVRDDVMHRPPRSRSERILNRRKLLLVISVALVMGLACFLVFLISDPIDNIDRARTLTFATIVSMILFIPFAFRSLERSIWNVGLLTNRLMLLGVLSTAMLTLSVMYIPFLRDIFELTVLGLADWMLPLGVAMVTLVMVELIKKASSRVG
ncbi:MAG: cation-translocating P-type ATPase [Methanosarcinaceae archaeon]